ncbi:MAG: bifunctional 4-hydroxy-2-oxoglutarate aldolase/2-dehydro-3-deoxy-phosphogluconate aldolase [Defluviitaleaceae bacterium]|nr:bifunctional 4-hydroxy-2-oxoglutarate aldolase/2-dehydro-3-deoxy-phosphogluconate aldolase [Defluviitaleaceae bacterium]
MKIHEEVNKRLFNCGIIPVIKLDDAGDSIPLMHALLAGGVDVMEITFRTAAAAEAIRQAAAMADEAGCLIGAGTVLTVGQVCEAVDAGAKFIVTPGFNPTVVKYCVDNGIPVYPGVSSPSEIESALTLGLEVLKFFPAEANGGVKMLKAMSAPYAGIKFFPTGGVDRDNLTSYLELESVVACGGTWIVREDLVKVKNFTEITRLTKDAVRAVHNFRFAHLGINGENEADAGKQADVYTEIFGFSHRDIGISVFASDFIEIMKHPGEGEFGHIGIRTTNLERAMAYLEKQGIELDPSTIKVRGDKPYFIYLTEPVGKFKVHLVQ